MGSRPGWPWMLLMALLSLCGTAAAQTTSDSRVVHHELSFPAYRQQYVEVVSTFPVSGEESLLIMPSWAPGAYRIRDFAANVDRLEVRDTDNRRLPARKVAKDAWRVALDGQSEIRVRYSVHAADLSVSASYVSPEFAMLNGTSVFLYTDPTRALEQRLTVNAPDELGEVLTSLEPEPGNNRWRASDYDELVDNPVFVAHANVQRFRLDGQDYVLAQVGDTRLWDLEKSLADVRRIIRATNALWDEIPLERPYWFFNVLSETGGGLEHDHATVMMTSRWTMRDRNEYIKWLSLVTHEYFHVWNVRRMRPDALDRYNYREEQYTGQLWLAEGITSYYDDLLLSRAGVVQPSEYFDRLALQFHTLEMTPGRRKLSLSEASHDAWIRQYQPGPNSLNSTVSYYVKGAVLGFVLDTQLRSINEGDRSLDDVLRAMWRNWSTESYPDDAFRSAVEEVGGEAVADWLAPLLNTTTDPDIDEALDWFGLQLIRDLTGNGNGAAIEEPAGFGINWSDDTEALVVDAVISGLSASEAGILPGDELLAIDDERVTRATLENRKRRLEAGTNVNFLVSRNDRILTVPVVLGPKRPPHFEIGLQEPFRNKDLRRMESWLGQNLAMPQ